MKNKLLAMLDERLRAQGQKGIDAAPTTTATPQPAPQVRTMPGHFDIFTQSLDQPEAAPPSDAELNRRARLSMCAAGALRGLTAQEIHEAARARQQAAGLYQDR